LRIIVDDDDDDDDVEPYLRIPWGMSSTALAIPSTELLMGKNPYMNTKTAIHCIQRIAISITRILQDVHMLAVLLQ
jgi:hypothetical protein